MPKDHPVKPSHHNFSTDHLLGNLKRRTISGGLVQAGAQGAQFALTLGYNVLMARLLTPHEFGLVAIVMTILGMLQIFRDMGLSTATIQRADITHAQVSNLFWLNTAVSGTISLLLSAAAPVIAWFFHEPSLIPIVLALSLVFTLNGLSTQHTALFNRNMQFGTMAAIELGAIAAGLSIGIALALAGFGYWSLVANTLTQALVRLVALWTVSSWRPQRPVRGVGTRPLISFGANLTLSGFIFSTSRGLDSLLIGRVYGSDAVGLYTRSAVLLLRPLEQLITPIYNVIVPVLSRLQTKPKDYRNLYLIVFEALAITGFLSAALAMSLARPLTLTLLGAKWEAAAAIFAGFSVAAIAVPLSTATSWLYTSQGRGGDTLRLSIAEAGINLASVLIGLPFGPLGVAIAFSTSGILAKLPLTFYLAGRSGPVSFRDLLTATLRHLPVGLAVGAAVWLTRSLLPDLTPLKQLFVCAPVGLLTGAATILLSPPSRQTCRSIFEALKEMRKPA